MFIATLICPPLITATGKKVWGCCAACLLDKRVRQTRAFFSLEEGDLGAISPKLSSVSVRHVQLLFLWDGKVASDTLKVFVS